MSAERVGMLDFDTAVTGTGRRAELEDLYARQVRISAMVARVVTDEGRRAVALRQARAVRNG